MDATLASSEKTEDSHKVDLELDDQPEARLMSFKKPIRNEEHPLPVSLPHQWGGNGVAFAALSHRGGRTGADPVPYKSEGTLRQAQGERNDLQHQRKSFRNAIHDALPITQQDYFTLVDTTGRLIREEKTGHISSELKPILKRFNIDPEQFMQRLQCQAGGIGGCES